MWYNRFLRRQQRIKGERKGKGEGGREKEENGRGGACPTNQKIVPAFLIVYSGCAPSLSQDYAVPDQVLLG